MNDSPGVHLIRSASADALASELATSLACSSMDPFAQPLILATGAASRRWLSQRIASATPRGICAGIRFDRPSHLLDLLDGDEGRLDPWSPESLVWAVLELGSAPVPGLEPMARSLDGSDQRYANALRIARLLGAYAKYRPDMCAAWSSAPDVSSLGLGFDAWQACLWRELHSLIERPDPVERRAQSLAGLRAGTLEVPWPLVAVFRPRRLSNPDAALLQALGDRIPINVYVSLPGASAPSELVAKLGHRRNETLKLLEGIASSTRDIACSAPPPIVEVHTSHGAERQVEVLRETLTGLFADDPSLEPRDVAVACPDVPAFAPHLHAAFSAAEHSSGWQHPGTELRVQVADRLAGDAFQLQGLLREVAALGLSRATASDLLSLASHPFVARRFGFRPEDAERLVELVPKAAIRWGLNPDHRARFGLGLVRQGTWQVGVQRLLLGEALSEDSLPSVGVVTPVDDVDSSDIELLGALAELVTRVSRLAAECLEPAPARTWVARFREIIAKLTEVPHDESWQLAQAWSVIERAERCAGASTVPLGLSDALALLDASSMRRATRPSYGNGSLVVGSIEEICDVPHRVLCIVGLNERQFPRRGIGDGDDLLTAVPRAGDPDPGTDDRQHLLDALESASDRLIVVYQGHSSLTHEVHPPPSGVAELMAVAGTRVIDEHLQPFAPAYFRGKSSSFDHASLAAALSLVGPRRVADDPFLVGSIPLTDPVTTLELNAVRAFLVHPARYFLRQRANLTLTDDEPVSDDLPIELDSLGRWKVGDRVLRAMIAGHPRDRVLSQERLRGDLPPGHLGASILDGVAATASGVVAARAPLAEKPAEDHTIDVTVSGIRLVGRAATRGDVTLMSEFGNVSPRHLAAAWLECLALTVALDHRVDAVVVGGRQRRRLAAPPPQIARKILGTVAQLAVEGLQRVLPIPPRVGHRWATARTTHADPLADRGLRTTWAYDSDVSWAKFHPAGRYPWLGRVDDEWWAQPSEPTQLGSLAALIWSPIVRAES